MGEAVKEFKGKIHKSFATVDFSECENLTDAKISELNIPLFAQLFKQLGQLPSFSFPQDDMELNILSKTLTENIKQTATRLY